MEPTIVHNKIHYRFIRNDALVPLICKVNDMDLLIVKSERSIWAEIA